MSGVQDRVAAAVAARGYRNGWTDVQFAVRQVAKLQEELGELAATMDVHGGGHAALLTVHDAGEYARWMFDRRGAWESATVDTERAGAELADVVVVCLVLADALGVDVLDAALAKAERDVARGVR